MSGLNRKEYQVKTDRSVKMFAATVFAFACLVAQSFGAVSVTASRDYVDKRTKLTPVTENGDVVGYKIGTNTNVVASAPWISGLIGNIPSWVWAMESPPLTSYSEADPTVPSWAKVENPPYLTYFTESDPSVGLTNGTIYTKDGTITPLTSFTESDPTVPSWAKVTTPPYLTSFTETDPNVPAWAKVATPPYLTSFTEKDPSVGLTNGTIYTKDGTITPLTSFTEADPTVPSWAKVTTPPYLTSYTETDPTVPAWAKVTTPPYLTSYTETDPNVPSWAKETNPPESVSPSVVTSVVQNIVSVTSSYMWDDTAECLYRIEPKNGNWYLDPVTNVNALLPENSHILIYLEEHKYDNE